MSFLGHREELHTTRLFRTASWSQPARPAGRASELLTYIRLDRAGREGSGAESGHSSQTTVQAICVWHHKMSALSSPHSPVEQRGSTVSTRFKVPGRGCARGVLTGGKWGPSAGGVLTGGKWGMGQPSGGQSRLGRFHVSGGGPEPRSASGPGEAGKRQGTLPAGTPPTSKPHTHKIPWFSMSTAVRT